MSGRSRFPNFQSRKHITKTEVTKIPSLSRVGQNSAIIIEVAGQDQLLVTVHGTSLFINIILVMYATHFQNFPGYCMRVTV